MKTKLDILNEIMADRQCMKVKCRNGKVLLDGLTAEAILRVYNGLQKEENKITFLNWDWDRIASFAWKKCSFKSVTV